MSEPLISSVAVEGLFGQYDYELPRKPGCFGDAVIIYGDNGVGKSTILRLVFDMLSPANNRGHRTALAHAPFSKIEIRMKTGLVIRAHRRNTDLDGDSLRNLELSISRDDEALAIWLYNPDEENKSLSGNFQWTIKDQSTSGLFEWQPVPGPIAKPHIAPSMLGTRNGNIAYLETLTKYVPIVFMP